MNYNIATVSGDGIGPEIVSAAKTVLDKIGTKFGHSFKYNEADIGGVAIDKFGSPLPAHSVETCKASHAVLLGAVGGDKWDTCPTRPEAALLGLRKELGLYANIRPAKFYKALNGKSPLKDRVLDENPDLVVVRELTGGIYFGERGYRNGIFGREAYDTEQYSEIEIERVARIAFELAETRHKKLTLIDKANVLLSSKLWRKVVSDINEDYPSVHVEAMYVDNAAMQLVLNPAQFDVILTSNIFGDILSDLTGALVGSIGIMPSSSMGATTVGLFEAIHGSAPTLAGLNVANPIGTILSAALMLRLSLNLNEEATAIEQAVDSLIESGYGTKDIAASPDKTLGTKELAEKIVSLI